MKNKNTLTQVLIPLLQEMIQNQCVNTGQPHSGNETKNALSIQKMFTSYGIESKVFGKIKNRDCILARVKGKNKNAPSLMFMGHLDVVPANASQWSCDPFCGIVKDGFVWGRGAVDMLNITAAQAVAFAETVRAHKRLDGDLVFLGVPDEEASGHLGADWITDKHWDKVKADYLVTELGGYFLQGEKGKRITISVAEKGIAWLRMSAKGKSGHGSMPYAADNAAQKIAEAAVRLFNYKSEVRLHPAYKAMIRQLPFSNALLSALQNPFKIDKSIAKLFQQNPGLAKIIHAVSRMTLSPDVLSAGQKINVIADSGSIETDLRILPDQSIEYVQKEITKLLGSMSKEFKMEFLEYFPSNLSGTDNALMQATQNIAFSVYPDAPLLPMMTQCVTDGRYWRKHGTVVYGFSLFDEDMSLTRFSQLLHGIDEKISIESLAKSLDYYTRLPAEFFSQPVLEKQLAAD